MRQQPRSHVLARVLLASAVFVALVWAALPLVSAQSSSIWSVANMRAQEERNGCRDHGPVFSDWSAPVNLGPPVNTGGAESGASESKIGLSLYFASSRPNLSGPWDLWVAQRARTGREHPFVFWWILARHLVEVEWAVPLLLGPNVNSSSNESHPALSLDEHRLYFVSNRPGPCGGADIYVSRRHSRWDDLGWEPAENLGCMADGYLNGPTDEGTPALFEDEAGAVIMYLSKGGDIWASVQRDDDSFGPPQLVSQLNASAPSSDNGATIRRDGLEVVFASNRPGGLGGMDLWMATRDSTSDPWSTPVNLSVLNSLSMDGCRLSLSFDGLTLYFTSDRPGGEGGRDLYMTTRTRVRKPHGCRD